MFAIQKFNTIYFYFTFKFKLFIVKKKYTGDLLRFQNIFVL